MKSANLGHGGVTEEGAGAQSTGDLPGLLTLRTAADMLGVPYNSLRSSCQRGVIPTVRLGSRRYIAKPVLRALLTGEGLEALVVSSSG